MPRLPIAMVGKTYNRVTVLSREGVDSTLQVTYNCLCSCGFKFIARGLNLRTGNTKSCGCLRAETNKNKRKHASI